MNVQPVDKSALHRQTDSRLNRDVALKLGTGWEKLCVIPDFCNSIEAASEILEHLETTPYTYVEVIMRLKRGASVWIGTPEQKLFFAEAEKAARAICLAFLKLP